MRNIIRFTERPWRLKKHTQGSIISPHEKIDLNLPNPSPTPTPSVTPTSSKTPTPTPTSSKTPTPTPTCSATPTKTPAITASVTPTPSVTPTKTPEVTPSVTPTKTPAITASVTPTPSVTPTKTPAITASVTPTPSVTPTKTPTPTPTITITNTPTPTQTPTQTPAACCDGFDNSLFITSGIADGTAPYTQNGFTVTGFAIEGNLCWDNLNISVSVPDKTYSIMNNTQTIVGMITTEFELTNYIVRYTHTDGECYEVLLTDTPQNGQYCELIKI